MPPFNWLDLCIIGVMGISGLVGLVRGLVREVFSLAAWAVAIWSGLHYGGQVADYLQNMIPLPSARAAVGFTLVFLVVLMFAGLFGYILARLIETTGLSGVDRLAGLLFGLARGALVVTVLVFLAKETPFPKDPWWLESRLVPLFQSMAIWLSQQIPPGYASQLGSQIISH
jgi:membrane protein required for colicin V production